MSLRTFTTLRDCNLKLWVDIIEQLTVVKMQVELGWVNLKMGPNLGSSQKCT